MSIRIGGLASGMDIDQLVSDLMKAERAKVDKLEQNKTILEWKQEQYNDVNKELANLIIDTKREFGLTTTTTTGSLVNQSVTSLNWVKSAASSSTTAADVSARADAAEGTYKVNVTQLAENWSAASSAAISVGDTSNIVDQFGLLDGDTINFTITTDEGSVTIDETNLSSVTLSDIIDDINSANIGVKAVYDSDTDRFFLQTTDTGSENSIKIEDASILSNGDTSFITGASSTLKLQYLDAAETVQNIGDGTTYTGQDAVFSFGAAQNIEKASNTFTLNGINFSLKAEEEFTITITTDVNAVYDKIVSFVEDYNELISSLSEVLTEERYRDYEPLTDEQKEAMSEEEIELWEERAKSGLLKSDSNLQNIAFEMRQGMYGAVSGITTSYSQLTEIGISTGSYFSGSENGELVINETALKEAIIEDADGVLNLLFKEPSSELNVLDESDLTSSQLEQKRSESGLVRRLYDNLTTGIKNIINKAGTGNEAALYRNVNSTLLLNFVTEYGSISMLDEDISDFEDRIDDMEDYLISVEDRYWSQFTAMETAINQMNQQSTWITQQFSTGA